MGIASGGVIGSVVGVQKYIYDVFGPAVSHAQKCRGRAEAMTIVADPSISDLLDSRFSLDPVEGDEACAFLTEAPT